MAKRAGPKGKKSKNRMTSAEVDAVNKEVENTNNVQDQPTPAEVEDAAAFDKGMTDGTLTEPFESTEDGAHTEGTLADVDGPGSIEPALPNPNEAAGEEVDEEEKVPNSVVKDKFKKRYIEDAKATGQTSKAARRSNWDWLAQTIAEHCLGEKDKIDIGKFTDMLDANGVDHSRWTNRNKGWEGRFRMTGRVALQRIVAANGVLKTMTGESIPPAEWVAKYKPKV